MNTKKYLQRILYKGETKIEKKVLFNLHRQHLLSVPFENLDIHYNRPITLDLENIYQKIVIEKRGGFCYELNGLFNYLLQELGFKTKIISARVRQEDNQYGAPYDHLAIIVDLDGMEYLVDVGFGQFILEPIEIKMGVPLIDPYGQFQFEEYENTYLSINKFEGDQLVPQYIFSKKVRQMEEFQSMCMYHQTNVDSHFTKQKLISIAQINGRITLNDDALKITKGTNTEVIHFEIAKFESYLEKYFEIKL